MINLSIEERGGAQLTRWLVTAPVGFASALREATRRATPLLAGSIRGFTPVHTGRLLSSISSDVQETASGATGKVVTTLRYARYVEFGTRKHGGPQRYFLKGERAGVEPVKAIYDYEIRRMVDTFPR